MPSFDYQRYLASKRSVEERALNLNVWNLLVAHLREIDTDPVRVLELGGGIGSMLLRFKKHVGDLRLNYTLVEGSRPSLDKARDLQSQQGDWAFEFVQSEIFDFLDRAPNEKWDLLIGHSLLDLLDISVAIPQFFSHLNRGGYCYFPITYDGLTIFEPKIPNTFEQELFDVYHRSMDQRVIGGMPSGDSRTGRRLLSLMPLQGGEILAAGASDWVVYPGNNSYPADEAFFLECILQTIEDELRKANDLDRNLLNDWLKTRRAQLAKGELIFIAHQLDILGRYPGRMLR